MIRVFAQYNNNNFRDLFSPNGEYCRVKKKECNSHYCWEKLKRGELDMERVR